MPLIRTNGIRKTNQDINLERMSLLIDIENSDVRYSPTVVRDLINSNRRRFGCVQPKTKKIMFFMMRRIVVRGAITFMTINKNRGTDTYYDIDDIVNELYLVLNNCADSFNTGLGKDFYLYFNSAVSRRINRISNYKRVNNKEYCFTRLDSDRDPDRDFNDTIAERFSRTDFNERIFWQDVKSLSLSDEQKTLVNSIYNYDKIKNVCEEHNISRAEYNKKVKPIKQVFKQFV